MRSTFRAGKPVVVEGVAVAGCSGLRRVESWLREASGTDPDLPDNDPAWKTAVWRPCELMAPPDDWTTILLEGTSPKQIWGFEPATGRPKTWPLIYGAVSWTARLEGLAPGTYEFRARTVDLNGCAQPEPRPYPKSGRNQIPCQTLNVTA